MTIRTARLALTAIAFAALASAAGARAPANSRSA